MVILTSCISSSVIVHLDHSFFSQNALSHYGIVSLEIVLILAPSINLKSSLKSIDLMSLVHWSLSVPNLCYYGHGYFYVCMFVCECSYSASLSCSPMFLLCFYCLCSRMLNKWMNKISQSPFSVPPVSTPSQVPLAVHCLPHLLYMYCCTIITPHNIRPTRRLKHVATLPCEISGPTVASYPGFCVTLYCTSDRQSDIARTTRWHASCYLISSFVCGISQRDAWRG